MSGNITAVQTGSGWDVDQTGNANLQGDLQPDGSIKLDAKGSAAVAAALGGLPGVVRTSMTTISASTAGQIVGNSFDPSAAPLQFEKDVLSPLMWSSDADAIRDGVRFSRNFLGYWADANRGTLLAPSSTKWKLGCGMAGQGLSVEPIVMQADGILPADEFTISFWLKSVGADFTTVTHGATLFRYQNYVGGYVTEGFRIDHNWEGQLEAQFYSSNSSSPWSNTYRVNLVLATGDIPADTMGSCHCRLQAVGRRRCLEPAAADVHRERQRHYRQQIHEPERSRPEPATNDADQRNGRERSIRRLFHAERADRVADQ